MARHIVCPSGLTLEVRGLKGKEANLFTNPALHRKGIFVDRILEACVVSVQDPGPYQMPEGSKVDWSKVLTGDRYYAVVQARIETYGESIEFQHVCANCGSKLDIDINLETDLIVKALPAEHAEDLDAGVTCHLEISGADVRFHMQFGQDEHKTAKRARADRTQAVTVAMATRIDSIEGVEPNDKLRWVEDLEMDDMLSLMAYMAASDCGVETSFKEDCESCYHENEVEVPLSSAAFWLPKKTLKL